MFGTSMIAAPMHCDYTFHAATRTARQAHLNTFIETNTELTLSPVAPDVAPSALLCFPKRSNPDLALHHRLLVEEDYMSTTASPGASFFCDEDDGHDAKTGGHPILDEEGRSFIFRVDQRYDGMRCPSSRGPEEDDDAIVAFIAKEVEETLSISLNATPQKEQRRRRLELLTFDHNSRSETAWALPADVMVNSNADAAAAVLHQVRLKKKKKSAGSECLDALNVVECLSTAAEEVMTVHCQHGGSMNSANVGLHTRNETAAVVSLAGAADENGKTFAMHLVQCGSIEAFAFVVSLDPTVLSHRDNHGMTMLMYAVCGSNVAMVEDLLARGCNVDDVDHRGRTAAMYAVWCTDSTRVLQHLLEEADASVTIRDENGCTLAMHAAWSGNTDLFVVVLANHGIVTSADHAGNTVSAYAAHSGNPGMAQLLDDLQSKF